MLSLLTEYCSVNNVRVREADFNRMLLILDCRDWEWYAGVGKVNIATRPKFYLEGEWSLLFSLLIFK